MRNRVKTITDAIIEDDVEKCFSNIPTSVMLINKMKIIVKNGSFNILNSFIDRISKDSYMTKSVIERLLHAFVYWDTRGNDVRLFKCLVEALVNYKESHGTKLYLFYVLRDVYDQMELENGSYKEKERFKKLFKLVYPFMRDEDITYSFEYFDYFFRKVDKK